MEEKLLLGACIIWGFIGLVSILNNFILRMELRDAKNSRNELSKYLDNARDRERKKDEIIDKIVIKYGDNHEDKKRITYEETTGYEVTTHTITRKVQ